ESAKEPQTLPSTIKFSQDNPYIDREEKITEPTDPTKKTEVEIRQDMLPMEEEPTKSEPELDNEVDTSPNSTISEATGSTIPESTLDLVTNTVYEEPFTVVNYKKAKNKKTSRNGTGQNFQPYGNRGRPKQGPPPQNV
ncbi:15187_t:CDS:1, partial [Gigaspora margarita]